jgi:uncharacterized protein YeaO (DUF488 family)
MIFTSYFANWRKFPKEYKTVSVSRYTKDYIKVDLHALELAPSPELLLGYKDGKITDEEYNEIYLKQLSLLDPKEIAKKYDNAIFLCYEKDGEFCHRHLIKKWLETTVKIEELK